ncbi:MAG: PEP-CTERM sorting domain-containing protein, partial [Alphaproteobacteria bacterium]|nr:PEP-CTERM sorting domain-containing protein [Alphaproteobacteria bacterium]
WLIFDLKASYSLSAVSLFNTKNATYNDTGSKDFDIQLSSDGVTYTPSLISGRLAWQNSSFQEYQFTNPTSARYVKINLTSAVTPAADGATGGSLGDIMRVGLQEVKIMGIPEPSALSLLAIGLAGLVTLRRRRRAV